MNENFWDAVKRNLGARPHLVKSLDYLLRPVEILVKRPLFDCHMCGQCVLHSTGMVCPMTCPKNLRNGPCGGVRSNGTCEVKPDMQCVWMKAYQRSQQLPWADEFHNLRPPVNWSLQGSSSWINYLLGKDQVSSGCDNQSSSALQIVDGDGS
jgi:hypothetical protein